MIMTTAQEKIPRVIEELVNTIFSFDEVESVILFGSRARGDANPRSDIDLAISAPEMKRSRWGFLTI